MQDSSGNNDGYTSLILKKTSSLFGLIGYFLGNQEYDKPEENTKRKEKKKLNKLYVLITMQVCIELKSST